MSIISEILRDAAAQGASDVHLKANQKPFYRVNGALVESGFEAIPADTMLAIVHDITPPHAKPGVERGVEMDFSHIEPGVGRFRVAFFMGCGLPALTLRCVKSVVPTLEDLRLPPQIERFASFTRGVVVVAGATGCGKSSTLAAIIQIINANSQRRVITIEDPIEFLFEDQRSVVTQREVGLDTESFSTGLHHILRQNPDIILIGEMRDAETIKTALLAAETGHLVFTTLHSVNAAQALPRLLNEIPVTERAQVQASLAENLRAVVCQRLLKDFAGYLIPAVEILLNTPTVKKILQKGAFELLQTAIDAGVEEDMQSFDHALHALVQEKTVTPAAALAAATNPEQFAMLLKGIKVEDPRRILAGAL
ncbi:MAG: PilT/PilU family type 4a pilus ATPase [Kiritimatiellaeota bacterium]|nr:PilT/PilU family type 4a pilus ATPase [Kiritimatiellota bacterium]